MTIATSGCWSGRLWVRYAVRQSPVQYSIRSSSGVIWVTPNKTRPTMAAQMAACLQIRVGTAAIMVMNPRRYFFWFDFRTNLLHGLTSLKRAPFPGWMVGIWLLRRAMSALSSISMVTIVRCAPIRIARSIRLIANTTKKALFRLCRKQEWIDKRSGFDIVEPNWFMVTDKSTQCRRESATMSELSSDLNCCNKKATYPTMQPR